MAFFKNPGDMCRPAQIYFWLSILAISANLTAGVGPALASMIGAGIAFLWACCLAWFCSAGAPKVSWAILIIFTLLPMVLLLILSGLGILAMIVSPDARAGVIKGINEEQVEQDTVGDKEDVETTETTETPEEKAIKESMTVEPYGSGDTMIGTQQVDGAQMINEEMEKDYVPLANDPVMAAAANTTVDGFTAGAMYEDMTSGVEGFEGFEMPGTKSAKKAMAAINAATGSD